MWQIDDYVLEEEFTLDEDTLTRFRDGFQFPEETRISLPRSGEKANAFAHSEVCFYKAAFISGLRFPIHPFIHKLLHHLKIAPAKLIPNSWQIVISCIEIWMIITEGDMIRLDKFVHLYRLKESSLISFHHFVIRSLDTSLCLVVVRRLSLTTFEVMFLGCCVGGRPQNSVCPLSRVIPQYFSLLSL